MNVRTLLAPLVSHNASTVTVPAFKINWPCPADPNTKLPSPPTAVTSSIPLSISTRLLDADALEPTTRFEATATPPAAMTRRLLQADAPIMSWLAVLQTEPAPVISMVLLPLFVLEPTVPESLTTTPPLVTST